MILQRNWRKYFKNIVPRSGNWSTLSMKNTRWNQPPLRSDKLGLNFMLINELPIARFVHTMHGLVSALPVVRFRCPMCTCGAEVRLIKIFLILSELVDRHQIIRTPEDSDWWAQWAQSPSSRPTLGRFWPSKCPSWIDRSVDHKPTFPVHVGTGAKAISVWSGLPETEVLAHCPVLTNSLSFSLHHLQSSGDTGEENKNAAVPSIFKTSPLSLSIFYDRNAHSRAQDKSRPHPMRTWAQPQPPPLLLIWSPPPPSPSVVIPRWLLALPLSLSATEPDDDWFFIYLLSYRRPPPLITRRTNSGCSVALHHSGAAGGAWDAGAWWSWPPQGTAGPPGAWLVVGEFTGSLRVRALCRLLQWSSSLPPSPLLQHSWLLPSVWPLSFPSCY